IVVVLAFLAYLMSPVGGAWYCDGRQCGASFWACCCLSSSARRDPNCSRAVHVEKRPSSKKIGTSTCPAGCNCIMIVSAESSSIPRASLPFMFPPPALLPLPVPAHMDPVNEQPVHSGMETRGPPSASALLVTPSLRAPPIA